MVACLLQQISGMWQHWGGRRLSLFYGALLMFLLLFLLLILLLLPPLLTCLCHLHLTVLLPQLVTFKQAVQTFPRELIPSEIAALVAHDPLRDTVSGGVAATSSYLRDREGPAVCSLINLSEQSVLPDMGLSAPQHRVAVFLGDVAIRGGKWYYEVRSRCRLCVRMWMEWDELVCECRWDGRCV